MRQPKTQEAQQLLAALDAELADAAKSTGQDLVWSAAEQDVLDMIGSAVDRRVELAQEYEVTPFKSGNKLKIATELRLLEGAIGRLYRQISVEIPQQMSVTSMKARRAANARWTRERMKQQNAT